MGRSAPVRAKAPAPQIGTPTNSLQRSHGPQPFEEESGSAPDIATQMDHALQFGHSFGQSGAVQRQAATEEIDRKPEEEELQRQAATEEEEIQPRLNVAAVQRQAEEEEIDRKPEGKGLQRQAVTEEEEIQPRLNMAAVQREPLKEEEDVQRQPEEEEDALQMRSLSVQPKLTIGQPGDRYEQEADRTAARVMAMPDTSAESSQGGGRMSVSSLQRNVQRQPLEEKEDEVAMKPLIQMRGEGLAAPENFEGQLARHKGGGQPLSDETRSFMEPRFGTDFSGVRVHEAPQEAGAIQAQAFTKGQDIYFNSGKYNPGSSSGKELLAHELTHTIQQKGAKRLRSKANKLELKTTEGSRSKIQAFQRIRLERGDTLDDAKLKKQPQSEAVKQQLKSALSLVARPTSLIDNTAPTDDTAPTDNTGSTQPGNNQKFDQAGNLLKNIVDGQRQENDPARLEGKSADQAQPTEQAQLDAQSTTTQRSLTDTSDIKPKNSIDRPEASLDQSVSPGKGAKPDEAKPAGARLDQTSPNSESFPQKESVSPQSTPDSQAEGGLSQQPNKAVASSALSQATSTSGGTFGSGASGGGGAAASAGGGSDIKEANVNEDQEAAAMEVRLAQAAPESDSPQLSSAEKTIALGALAEDPVVGSPPSGGGGGGAIAETEIPSAPPNVSQSDPSSAIASVSRLPPAQLLSALGGVTAAVSNEVGKQKAEFAANPPQADTSPGAETSAVPQNQPTGDNPKPVIKQAEGEAKPVLEPEPLSPEKAPPDVVTPPPAVQGTEEGKLSDADVHNMKSSLSQLPARDSGANEVSVGSPPTLSLEGNANPQKAKAQKAELDSSLTEAEAKGRQELAQPTGAENIKQTLPQQTLKAQVGGGVGGAAAVAAGAAAAIASGAGDGSGDAASIFAQQEKGVEIQAAAVTAQSNIAAKKQEHATKVAEEQATTGQNIEQLKQQNADQQAQEKVKAREEVAGLQGQWSQEQNDLVSQSRKDADKLVSEGLQEVETERAAGEQEAAKEVQKGEKKAEAERQKGEEKAAAEKAKGEKESSGFFGWLTSKAKAFFDGIKKAIKKAFEAARAAMRKAIEAAKKLAAAAIEKARKAIVAVIRRVGDALIALGDTLLAKWPGLRDKWRNAIEKRVQQAEDAVNALAAKLNEGIQKALDVLGSALDAALGLLEKGMLAVVSVYEGVVMGAIKFGEGVAKSLGAFAVLAKDIVANPGQWISNLGAAVSDGIKNHLWGAFQEQVTVWFNQKLEAVLGLGAAVWKILSEGGISMAEVGKMAWAAVKQALPTIIIGVLLERLVSMIVPAAGAVLAIIQGLQAAWGTVSQIIQAFGRFMTFLKAIKAGAAGPQFGALLASAAIVLLDFITNFIIVKIAKAARKVAGKLKGLAKSLKRRVRARKGNKNNKSNKSKASSKKESKNKKLERLKKAMKSAKSSLKKYSDKKVGINTLKLKLKLIKLRYRLKSIEPIKQGKNWSIRGEINPVILERTDLQVLNDPDEATAIFLQRAADVEKSFFGLRQTELEQELMMRGGSVLPNPLESQMMASTRGKGEPKVERVQLEGVSSSEWIEAALGAANRRGQKSGRANLFQQWGDVRLTDWLNPSPVQPANRFVRNIGRYDKKGSNSKPGTLKIVNQLREGGLSDSAISQLIQESSRSGRAITPGLLTDFGHRSVSPRQLKAHAARLTRLTHLTMHLEPARFLDRGLSVYREQPVALTTAMGHEMVKGGNLGLDSVLGRGELDYSLSSRELIKSPLAHSAPAPEGIARKDATITAIMGRVHRSWSQWKRQTQNRLVRQARQKGVADPHFVPTKVEMQRILESYFGAARGR